MKKRYLLLVLILIVFFISGCSQEAYTSGCYYIYKFTNDDYFNYISAGKMEIDGEWIVSGWPHGIQDQELINGYVFGGGGCSPFTDRYKEVIVNIKKSDVNLMLGQLGCTELQRETYPECYINPQYKPGTPGSEECDKILEQESNGETSICPQVEPPTLEDTLDEEPYIEFYVCEGTVGQTVEEFNKIISNEQLNELCERVI
jgi:hypothetical protein